MTTDDLREKARRIAEALSQGRVDSNGGYHDEWYCCDVDGVPSIVIATLDPGKDYAAPDLRIESLEDFIQENEWALYTARRKELYEEKRPETRLGQNQHTRVGKVSHHTCLEPASSIIELFGGVPEVAELVGVHESRVRRWTYPKERGGTGGTIPFKHLPGLLSEAKRRRLPVRADDFLPAPAPRETEATA